MTQPPVVSISKEEIDVKKSYAYQEEPVLFTVDGRIVAKASEAFSNPRIYEIKAEENASEVVFVSDKDFEQLKTYVLKASEEEIAEDEGFEDEEEALELDNTKVDKLFLYIAVSALKADASDIHITPKEKKTEVKFRINGVLELFKEYPSRTYAKKLINKIKIYANMDTANTITPQDGKFKKKIGDQTVEFRVSTVPLVGKLGERAVLRIQKSSSIFKLSLKSVGFEEEDYQKYRKALENSYGMIIDVGGTGEGKSTTLMLSILELVEKYKGTKAILTVEDPVEIDLSEKGIVQTEVDEKQGRTYPKVLRAFLRQDPDVIMVGEIRDEETAHISVQAAMTGHLVLSTLHATDSINAIERLKDLGISPILIASTVNVFLSQRLVRTLCPHCRRKVKLPPDVVKKYNLDFDEAYEPGEGCEHCKNGWIGRTAVFEILELDPDVKELIVNNASSVELKKVLKEKGFKNLWHNGLLKVKKGITSLAELELKVSPDQILNRCSEAGRKVEFGVVFYPEKLIPVKVKKTEGHLYDVSTVGLSVVFDRPVFLELNRPVKISVGGKEVVFTPKSYKKLLSGKFVVGGTYTGDLTELLEA